MEREISVATRLIERGVGKDYESVTQPKGFRQYLSDIRPEVNTRIEYHLSILDPEENLSADVISMLMRGKRLRAGIAMMLFDAFAHDADKREMALDLASALELAHSASLILDDMLDEDEERRGYPTFHVTKGHKRAMLETVGILSFPYSIVSKYGKDFVGPLSRTHRTMVYGVLKEVIKRPNLPASAIYEEIITRKTGDPFGLSARYGALAASCSPENVEILSHYGLWTGRAMQIANDITDLRGIMTGEKSTGFGSEVLLLQCMVADSLFKEVMSDIKAQRLQSIQSKFAALWRPEGLEEELTKRLDKAIDQASRAVKSIDYGCFSSVMEREQFDRWLSELSAAPREISEMMLEE